MVTASVLGVGVGVQDLRSQDLTGTFRSPFFFSALPSNYHTSGELPLSAHPSRVWPNRGWGWMQENTITKPGLSSLQGVKDASGDIVEPPCLFLVRSTEAHLRVESSFVFTFSTVRVSIVLP